MNRMNPANREEAFAHQFEDDVKLLKALSQTNKESFRNTLQILKTHIEVYEKESAFGPKEVQGCDENGIFTMKTRK